ncbi:putative glycoside hydrolase [Butyrivibrio sp. JL13D10]|uniref:putative glycoside hydrolase n=1 Tax=Butyrivibrio sp. JL13D10 TaxID=3236815 RepID=UPI0038B4A0D8
MKKVNIKLHVFPLILAASLMAMPGSIITSEGALADTDIEEPITGLEESSEGTGSEISSGNAEDTESSVKVQPDNDSQDEIHGIYVSAHVAGTSGMMNEIIEHIDETSINAVVIDVKTDEGRIAFDMDSEFIDGLGVEDILVKDMPGLLETLHEHGVYAIARCVAFRDPFIDEIKPEWMLKNADGSVYEDAKGFNWIDPRVKEARDYLIEVAKGCRAAGFDEVQFDYVRFPTGIKEEDIGINGYGRRRAVYEFVRYAHADLKKEAIPLSLDVFGTIINSVVDSDIVGQEYPWLSMDCEYLSPMIYPSHYYEGTMGIDYPDLHPYETIDGAMKNSDLALKIVNPLGKRQQAKVRPWLQGFTASYLSKYRTYGVQELQDQIRAVNDNGVYSWIIWNPSCKYQWDAFK